MQLDVLIFSASRPVCLKRLMTSFLQKVRYSGGFRFLLHEDFVFEKASLNIRKFVEESKLFDVYVEQNPPIRTAKGMYRMMPKIKSDFYFRLEDDFEFEADLDLDVILSIMREYKHINQITFPMQRTKKFIPEVAVFQVGQDKITLSLGKHWTLGLSICKTSYVMERLHLFAAPSIKMRSEVRANFPYGEWPIHESNDWLRKHLGAYFWGDQSSSSFYRIAMHTGSHLRMRSLDLKNPQNSLPTDPVKSLEEIHLDDEINKHPNVEVRSRPTREDWIKENM